MYSTFPVSTSITQTRLSLDSQSPGQLRSRYLSRSRQHRGQHRGGKQRNGVNTVEVDRRGRCPCRRRSWGCGKMGGGISSLGDRRWFCRCRRCSVMVVSFIGGEDRMVWMSSEWVEAAGRNVLKLNVAIYTSYTLPLPVALSISILPRNLDLWVWGLVMLNVSRCVPLGRNLVLNVPENLTLPVRYRLFLKYLILPKS